VCRVDRADGTKWIARVFPPARSLATTKDDAKALAFLAAHDFPSERLADATPVTVVDDHAVLVTEFAEGKAPSNSRDLCRWIGDHLGRLHTLPTKGAPTRAGGGWHHLSLNAGGRAADVATLLPLLDELAASSKGEQRKGVQVIRDALTGLDLCKGLPQAFVHVDFGGPNLLKAKDGTITVIDWTGSGKGARIEALASVLTPMQQTGLEEIVGAYRQHVSPTDKELAALPGTMLTHQLVLAAWGTLFRPDTITGLAAQLPAAPAAIAVKADQIVKLFSRA